jgi:large subunit ribosomal protein L1
MAKLTRRRRAILEKLDGERLYPIEEAVNLLSEFAKSKFKESIDVAVNLGVDPRKSDQAVRGATTLPHGTGKTVRVAVFAQGEAADKAKAAGADVVGFEDLADRIKGGSSTSMWPLPHRMPCASSASSERCSALAG